MKDSLNHLKFERKKVKFYPEDVERMNGMTLEEQVEYKAILKRQHRYAYIKEETEK